MSEKQDIQNTESGQKEIIKVGAYFMVHQDELNDIAQSLLLLNDYGETWKIIRKRNRFYILYDGNRQYLKLWKDQKDNLLFYFGNIHYNLFFDTIEISVDNTGCVIYTDNSIQCGGKVIEFRNLNVIDIIRQVDYRLVNPFIWLICTKLY